MNLDCKLCGGGPIHATHIITTGPNPDDYREKQERVRCGGCFDGVRPCELCWDVPAMVEHPLWDDEVSCLACEAISQAEMGWAL